MNISMTSDSLTPDYRNRIAFVILSCDKYSDLWDICVDRLRRHWPDIPMDIYMIANYKRCEHPGVTTLLVGDDKDWSSTVRAAITQLVQPYVFFWFEDALLDQDINNENIVRYFEWAMENKARYLRLRNMPRPNERVAPNIGKLYPNMPYRNTCFSALWERDVFLEILNDGESAADFEMIGTGRSDVHDGFYGIYRPELHYIHGVVRGRWIGSSLRALHRAGDQLVPQREVMSRSQEVIWRINEIKKYIVSILPPRWATTLFALKRTLLSALTSPEKV